MNLEDSRGSEVFIRNLDSTPSIMSDTDDNNDGEGVWSPDIEQCFREALLLFPPCGRRKHILQEEGGGKMYGRNELIARHIMMKTGKVRTRKQVSSHIQVLARRKAKAETPNGSHNTNTPSPASSVGTASIDMNRARSIANTAVLNGNTVVHPRQPNLDYRHRPAAAAAAFYDVWADRPIVTPYIRLVEFSAFIEYRVMIPNQLPSANTNLENRLINQTVALASLASAAASTPSMDIDQPADQSIHFQTSRHPPQPYQTSVPYGEDLHPRLMSSFPHQPAIHPLALNHQVPAQFNQANSYPINNQQPLLNGLNQHHQPAAQHAADLVFSGAANHNAQPHALQQQAPGGFTRHSFVKIDFRQPTCRQTNKLERIDIGQIQDKFPEIDGLYQRSSPDAFFLVKFWADIKDEYEYGTDDQNSHFGFSCGFETVQPYKDITCSTKACSYGLQVVEKVEKIFGEFNQANGRFTYEISRSSMCEFMIQFIKKLRQLPRTSQMNSVLEHFTVLQIVTNEATSEVLLCLAYAFEITSPEQNNGSQYHVYKLTKDQV